MFHKIVLSLIFGLSFSIAQASETFLLYDLEKNEEFIASGNIDKRVSPCSTFKIPIALMGYEEGILKTSEEPLFPYNEETAKDWHGSRKVCEQDQTPQSWMSHSVIWYSQVITRSLGVDKFKAYIEQFDYGNKDASAVDGLTQCWLSSTLKISPHEQIAFLKKIVERNLGLKKDTYDKTASILALGDLNNGWRLFSKTGSGDQETIQPNANKPYQQGWFVGWIEKEKKIYLFAYLLEDDKEQESAGGLRAKQGAIEKLKAFVNDK